METEICRFCNGKVHWETDDYYINTKKLVCENCGILDPTDLIDKCVKCDKLLDKNENVYCKEHGKLPKKNIKVSRKCEFQEYNEDIREYVCNITGKSSHNPCIPFKQCLKRGWEIVK